MENRIVNIEKMSVEELSLLQERINQRKQKSIEERLVSIEKEFSNDNSNGRVVQLENKFKKAIAEIENQKIVIKKLEAIITEQGSIIKDVSIETNKVTKTLLTHGYEQRKLENKMHSLIYKEIPKTDTLRNELFHGVLTESCKRHINKSLGVSAFKWIEINDIVIVEGLIKKYLNKTTIHNLMQRKADEWMKEYNESKDKGLVITSTKARKFSLLDQLADELGGNINAI